jgi:hypothetical protein
MIGWLVKDFFGASPMLAFPKIALILFLIVFVVVSIRTLLLKKTDVDARAHLALEDGNIVPVKAVVSVEKHHG